MMASKQELSEACLYYPLVCVTDRTDAGLSFEKDEERGIETAVSAAKDTTGKSCATFAEEQAQYDARKAANRNAILDISIYGILFGFALFLTVDLIAIRLSDLKSLSMHHHKTGAGFDSARFLAQMSDRFLMAWIVRPILVMEVITYGSILAWDILLVPRSLRKIFKGTDHETFAILKGFDNDALMFYTAAFVYRATRLGH
jgi:hypothetical protein